MTILLSKTTFRGVAEGLLLVFVSDFAGVDLVRGMHPQTRETSKLYRNE
jgi:hypothetical protein